jgi:hypothetical protein
MADTAVAITAGSGTNIDTRTEATNGNHRQVIVVGDPSTNAGVAPVDATTGLVVNIAPGVDKGSGTGGSLTPRVIIDSSQLASNRTTAQTMSAGFQLVGLPTDAPLPAGTNAIGKLAANSGVDIGDVDVTSISAGENHLGEVGGKSAYRVITMSTDTGAYASGDLIADTQQYDAFFRKADGTGVINTITVTEKDAQGAAFYIIFHRTSTSMGTENSAPNISDANLVAGIQHIVAVATTDFVTVSGTKIATLKNLGLPVMAVSGTDDLYISILNSTGTPTYASGEIQLGIGVLLD